MLNYTMCAYSIKTLHLLLTYNKLQTGNRPDSMASTCLVTLLHIIDKNESNNLVSKLYF